jgi:hypothetical protein
MYVLSVTARIIKPPPNTSQGQALTGWTSHSECKHERHDQHIRDGVSQSGEPGQQALAASLVHDAEDRGPAAEQHSDCDDDGVQQGPHP